MDHLASYTKQSNSVQKEQSLYRLKSRIRRLLAGVVISGQSGGGGGGEGEGREGGN